MLFRSDYHFGSRLFQRLGETQRCRVILKVGTVVTENIRHPEAEFDFRNKFEIRKIKITAEAYAQVEISIVERNIVAPSYQKDPDYVPLTPFCKLKHVSIEAVLQEMGL